MVVLFVVLMMLVFLTIDYFVQKRQVAEARSHAPAAFDTTSIDLNALPSGVFLDRGHLWNELVKDGELRVGVDELIPYLLGAVEKVELPRVGETISEGEPIAVLSRGDREIVVRAPADGTVTSVNGLVRTEPELLEQEPYTHGWLLAIKPADLGGAFSGKLIGESARKWLRIELGKLRDLIAGLAPGNPAFATLQDGGMPVRGALMLLPDDQWRVVAEWIADPTTR